MHRFVERIDDAQHVICFFLKRIALAVSAFVAPAPINRVDGEALRQWAQDGYPARLIFGGAVQQHQRRPHTAATIGNLNAIPR